MAVLIDVRDARAVVDGVVDVVGVIVEAQPDVHRSHPRRPGREVVGVALVLVDAVVRAAVGPEHDVPGVLVVVEANVVPGLVDP